MRFELFVAFRYLFSRRKQTFISVISAVSILGLTIGVASLVIALSLITGFQRDLQGKILKATSHIMASSFSDSYIRDWKAVLEKIRKFPFVRRAYPQWITPVLIGSVYTSQPAMLRGVERDSPPDWLRELPEGGILIGDKLAMELGLRKGDKVSLYLPRATLTPFGPAVKVRRVEVKGFFSSGLYELDKTSAVFVLEESRRLLGLEPAVNYINIEVDDIYRAEEYAQRLSDSFEGLVFIPWKDINRSLFEAFKLERKVLFFTIGLIVVVASLNIIASLILLVMEKIKDIGVLRSMGATAREIARIFMLQGFIIGLIGVLVGESLGVAFAHLANRLKLIKVPPDIYQISYVPFLVQVKDLVLVAAFALLISFTATIYPSRRAAAVDPSEAIKYE